MEKKIPKYKFLCNEIKEKIESGALVPNEFIGTEEKLASTYHLSRVTVRKAINQLISEGYLARKHGLGAFVNNFVIEHKVNDSVVSFTKSAIRRGDLPTTIPLLLEVIHPSPFIANALRITTDDWVYHVERVRYTNSFPLIYEDAYFPKDLVGELTEEIITHSIFKHLETKFKISYAHQSIDAIAADEKMAKHLHVNVGFPLLRSSVTHFTEKHVPFEFAFDLYRSDRWKISTYRETIE
jgi:Transcriptional regulators